MRFTARRQELVERASSKRIGEGKRGNPWRYLMAGQDFEKTVLPYSSTSRQIQQYSNPETAADAEDFEKAVLPYSSTSRQIQQYSKSESEERPCRACGKSLSEAEAAVSFQLHWDCSLPNDNEERETTK